MDLAAVENRHRLIDQLHAFGTASKRDQGQPLVRERLALEVEVVELSRQLDGFSRLGGEGPDVGDRTANDTQLDPTALDALPFVRQHGATARKPAAGCDLVVEPFEINSPNRCSRYRSPPLAPLLPESSVGGLCGRKPSVEVMNHVFEERHLELDVRIALAFKPIEQVAPPLLQVWSLQGSSETCVCCRHAALEGECLQLAHVPGQA